jgi:hypothetical protein
MQIEDRNTPAYTYDGAICPHCGGVLYRRHERGVKITFCKNCPYNLNHAEKATEKSKGK